MTSSNSCSALDLITDCLFDFYYSDKLTTPVYYSSGAFYPQSKYYFDFKAMNAFPTVDYPPYPVMDHEIDDQGTHTLKFAIPECDKEDILLKVEDDILIVKRISHEPVTDEDGNHYGEKFNKIKVLHNKIATRDFEVSFKISDKLDTSKITSHIDRGVLYVKIPLSEEIKKKERIIPIE